MSPAERFAALVIGGGVMGLATLEHLARSSRGERVGLVERWSLGHARGSSHGASRIARSTYATAIYARLMRRARAEDWPRLERDAGEKLLHSSPGCFFGPSTGPIAAYRAAVREAGVGADQVEEIDVAEARRRHPSLRFDAADAVLDDRTCAVVAAARTVEALARLARAHGAEVVEGVHVTALEPRAAHVDVVTDRGTLEAERVILAAGPWSARLWPALDARLTVLRQTVAYLPAEGDPGALALGRCPIWVELGDPRDGMHYALPDLDRGLLKIAHHRVVGGGDDPDDPRGPSPLDVAALQRAAERQMTVALGPAESSETCHYTCTASEDFILDVVHAEPRVVVGAGFSGHGFKFAPLVGRILSELALDGRTSVAEVESERQRFSWEGAAA